LNKLNCSFVTSINAPFLYTNTILYHSYMQYETVFVHIKDAFDGVMNEQFNM